MEFSRKMLANTFALSTAILWVACSIIVWLFPKFSLLITKWWVHGMEIDRFGGYQISLTNVLLGGVTLVISAWATGYVFGWVFEYLNKK